MIRTVSAALCKSARDPTRCLALNYSPWYAKFPGRDARVTGAAEAAELAYFKSGLLNISGWLRAEPGVGVGAFLLDSEKFAVQRGTPAALALAITRKCDLIYNLSLSFFPSARVEWYNRGSVTSSYTYGWVGPVGAPPRPGQPSAHVAGRGKQINDYMMFV